MAYRVTFALFVFIITAALAACTGGRRGGGVIIPGDGGTDTGGGPVDSGGGSDSEIVLMDTGTMPECDPVTNPCPVGQTCVSGTCETDPMPECLVDSDCPTGEICSGEMCVPDTMRICEGSEVPYNRVSVCSASTNTCIMGCTDSACISSCLDADPNPDCSACVNQNFVSCLNDAGCQTTWDPYVCCIEDNCGTMATSSCVSSAQSGACASTYGAWESCTMTADVEPVCPSGSFLTDCF